MSERQENPQNNGNIVKINPREHVRLRPGMYIGGTDRKALHYLIYEVVDHSLELAFVGQCNHIWITLRDNNEVCIHDNGTEIPVDIDKATGRPLLEIFMTHVGVSNDRLHGFPEKRYTGLHSMGLWAINALTEWLSIEATYKGYLWKQEYKEGVPQTKVLQIRSLEVDEPQGMTITLRPDFTIFEANLFDYDAIVNRVRECAYLAAGVSITVADERKSPALKTELHFPDGMADVVRDINKNQQTLHEIVHYQGRYTTDEKKRHETFDVEFALQYTNSNETVIKSYVNTWCMDGGTQIEGLQSGLIDVINAKAGDLSATPFTWDEIKIGLTVGLNIKMDDPSFESQMRIVLINPEAHKAVAEVVHRGMNKQSFDAIMEKCKVNRNAGRL